MAGGSSRSSHTNRQRIYTYIHNLIYCNTPQSITHLRIPFHTILINISAIINVCICIDFHIGIAKSNVSREFIYCNFIYHNIFVCVCARAGVFVCVGECPGK